MDLPSSDSTTKLPPKAFTFKRFTAFLHRQEYEFVTVFGWFVLFLLVFYSGHFYSSDTVTKVNSATNLLCSGSFAIDMGSGAWGVTGANGGVYPHFSIGSILMMIPAAAIQLLLSKIAPMPAELLGALVTGQNLIITAVIGTLLFVIFRHYSLSFKKSFLCAAAIVVTGQLLPYSSVGWSEPAALMWSVAAFTMLAVNKCDTKGWILWGILAGAASLIRIEYSIFFAVFWIISVAENKRVSARHIGASALYALLQSGHLFFNMYRFGTSADFGYIGNESRQLSALDAAGSLADKAHTFFSDPDTMRHAYWFFLSFGKVHWFWVSPLLILAPLVPVFRRYVPQHIMRLFISAAIVSPLYVYFINTASWCCTSWCWGYRYYTVIFPFLLLPTAFFVFKKMWLRICALTAATTGFFISAVVSMTNYHLALENLILRFGYDDVMWGRTARFGQAPFWEHLRLFCTQIGATVILPWSNRELSWSVLREKALDIWPVGLSAMGVAPAIAMGAWCALIILLTAYTRFLLSLSRRQ